MTEYKLDNGKTLQVIQDENPLNPRIEWDNLGTMVCFHRRYDLGDSHSHDANDFRGWADMKDSLIKNEDVAVILPLYLYDHSGITISTSPFSCPWDSGQIGFIYISKEKVRKEYSVKKISKQLIERVTEYLKGEVNTYDQYLTGDVYGFKLIDENGEEEDSCWGFFGHDIKTNGILEHVEGNLIKA